MQQSTRLLAKLLAWAFWGINLAIICGVWAFNHAGLSTASEWFLAIGRLTGLLATYAVLVQLVVIGRVGWLEPVFGFDKLAIFHRRNGLVALSVMLLHPELIVLGYALASKTNYIEQFLFIARSPTVILAILAATLFITAVTTSIYAVRKHLKFEWWHAIHFINYAAVGLVIWHQLNHGADILGSQLFTTYWIGLYVFAALNILTWRWIRPIVRSQRFQFKVARVEKTTPSATSVYIEGKGLEKFGAKGGQFVTVRFLTPQLWIEEHPFSLSMLPGGDMLRITARQLGDFTNAVPNLKPGTKVIVGGPYGSFTKYLQRTDKLLYIAGGIGITPIRTLLEERAKQEERSEAILLYGNRSIAETALWSEVQALAKKTQVTVHNILSEQPDWAGEKGFIDKEKIQRLVPDIAERDVYLCGPPPMVNAVVPLVKALNVPERQLHFERFSLHKQ